MPKRKSIKHLGQNFLVSKKITERVVETANLNPDDIVLEVGPGKGIFTRVLLERLTKGKLIAVEKDKKLVEVLKQNFRSYKNLIIIHDDILKFNPSNFKLHSFRYKIVANIPYYLTSIFIRNFLQSDYQPSKMVLIVQKEVAKRIAAKDGRESILSISVKSYGQPRIIKFVPARYFSPQPKVDSAILLIDNISKNFFESIAAEKLSSLKKKNLRNNKKNTGFSRFTKEVERIFFELVKKGFSGKRKLLKNNLKCDLVILKKCGIQENIRPENLTLENWKSVLKLKLQDII